MAQLQTKTPAKKLTAETLKANPLLATIARQRAAEIRALAEQDKSRSR